MVEKAIEAEKELVRLREERNALWRSQKAATTPAVVSEETAPPSESEDGMDNEDGSGLAQSSLMTSDEGATG